MNNHLSPKFAALGLALLINGLMIGSMAYLFSTHVYAAKSAASGVHRTPRVGTFAKI